MIKKLILGMVILPLSLASTSALAAHHEDDKKCMMKVEKKAFKELNLSDSQKEKLAELRKSYKEKNKARKEQRQQLKVDIKTARKAEKQEMQNLILANNFDEQAVRNLIEKMLQPKIDSRVEMARQRHQMMNVLTAEQKTKFKTYSDKHAADCAK